MNKTDVYMNPGIIVTESGTYIVAGLKFLLELPGQRFQTMLLERTMNLRFQKKNKKE